MCVTNKKRHTRKAEIIKYLGGKCNICHYNKCVAALHVHHKDPAEKDFNLGGSHCLSWEKTKQELNKCMLLCANCHAEIHYAPVT